MITKDEEERLLRVLAQTKQKNLDRLGTNRAIFGSQRDKRNASATRLANTLVEPKKLTMKQVEKITYGPRAPRGRRVRPDLSYVKDIRKVVRTPPDDPNTVIYDGPKLPWED